MSDLKFKCDFCNTEFVSYFEDTKQASGCAAEIEERDGIKFLYAGYGSLYDNERFLLNKNLKVGLNMCDDCIAEKMVLNEVYVKR